ncbi:MAG: hypothetical protein NZL91_06040 [Thermoflexales bacterium]|nr:hypothetical protein [Thermoflexales bacterium]MCS7324668.1 hypothetical protein [Thermoflexales bacterium]MCX7939877.1 hypothetical protein [Thermoflexales bacterium]MDW8053179.1 hypothetical protein [Anaerolineae bacterium]MDW8291830.1 hypothetical protein [Anaerolineae bacterium]
MSKKTKRRRVPNLPPEAFRVPAETTIPSVTPVQNAAAVEHRAVERLERSTTATHLRAEYRVVLQDLRTTLMIFAGLLSVMVVLSFFIR